MIANAGTRSARGTDERPVAMRRRPRSLSGDEFLILVWGRLPNQWW